MKTFVVIAALLAVGSCGFIGGGGHGGSGFGGGFGGGHGGSGQDEDGAALSAVGLTRLLGGGASHAHLISGGGASYTISGPTQEIKSVHKIMTTSSGGQILARTGGSGGGGHAKIIVVQGGGHGGSSGGYGSGYGSSGGW